MSLIQMDVQSYRPRHEKEWSIDPSGTRKAKLYTCYGLVEVFSFPGDGSNRAFTSLEMFIDPFVYHATLPRHYHDRWIMRLAEQFGCECYNRSLK